MDNYLSAVNKLLLNLKLWEQISFLNRFSCLFIILVTVPWEFWKLHLILHRFSFDGKSQDFFSTYIKMCRSLLSDLIRFCFHPEKTLDSLNYIRIFDSCQTEHPLGSWIKIENVIKIMLLLCLFFQKCENWKWNFVMTACGLENTKPKMKNFVIVWKRHTSVAVRTMQSWWFTNAACNFKSSMFLTHLLRRIVLLMIIVCCIWIYEQHFWNTWYFSIHGFIFPL